MVKEASHKQLRSLLADYEEDGFLAEWNENHLLEILRSLDEDIAICFSWERELTKKEKRLFIQILKDFGGMDSSKDVPTGRAMEVGYGSRIQMLIKKFTPRWKRWIGGPIEFCLSCLIAGLLTKWLLHSFGAGVFTVLISRAVYRLLEYIPVTYLQNELLIRRRYSLKRKKVIAEE
jgi:hypothetical protein